MSTRPFPPITKKKPSTFFFGAADETRGPGELMNPPVAYETPYDWLHDKTRKDPEVLGHLTEENGYTAAMTEHLHIPREELFDELLSYIHEAEVVPTVTAGPFDYYRETVPGQSFTIYSRAPVGAPAADRKVYFNENAFAARLGSSFTSFGAVAVSPDSKFVAFSVDVSGNERHSIYIREIDSEKLVDVIDDTTYDFYWGRDSETIFYTSANSVERSYKLWRHTLKLSHIAAHPRDHKAADADKVPRGDDILLYTEPKAEFVLEIVRTVDARFLIVTSFAYTASKQMCVRLTVPAAVTPRVHTLVEAQEGRLVHLRITRAALPPYHANSECGTAKCAPDTEDCDLDPCEGSVVAMIRDAKIGEVEFTLARAPLGENVELERWAVLDKPGRALMSSTPVVPPLLAFDKFVAVLGRENAAPQVFVVPLWEGEPSTVSFGLPVRECHTHLRWNGNSDATTLRVGMSSMTTPPAIYDYDVNTKELKVVHQVPVNGEFDAADYACAQFQVPSTGGVSVPVSIVWRKKSKDAVESEPPAGGWLHLYAYGSYGICSDPVFRVSRLPLLKRGVAYALAHIRGGGDCGYGWYDPHGKLLTKQNTFDDFTAIAEWLVAKNYTVPAKLSCEGRSAGGLTMGVAINMRPELYRACILGVPFVDALRSMADPTIPLTIEEWLELGNPNEKAYYECLKSYSPIDNLKPGAKYPPSLLLAGLHDPRVGYWEPAKYCAARREVQAENAGPCLLKCDMEYGHFSTADRYKNIKESAWWLAWLLEDVVNSRPHEEHAHHA